MMTQDVRGGIMKYILEDKRNNSRSGFRSPIHFELKIIIIMIQFEKVYMLSGHFKNLNSLTDVFR